MPLAYGQGSLEKLSVSCRIFRSGRLTISFTTSVGAHTMADLYIEPTIMEDVDGVRVGRKSQRAEE